MNYSVNININLDLRYLKLSIMRPINELLTGAKGKGISQVINESYEYE